MINLKKINKLREGITLRDRPASQYGHLPGPRYGMDDKDDDSNTTPSVPKTERDKKIKAALDQAGKTFPKPIAQRPKYPKLKEAKDPREYDYEGDMAKSQLRSIISNAQEIHDMLEDNTNIAEWVQSKITLSADYITTVRDYMNSEVNEGSVGYHSNMSKNAKSLATQHKHAALAMKTKFKPKTNPYKIPVDEEVEQLDEVKVGDKVTFDHPMAAIPGKMIKVTGTVHNIENDVVHIKSKDKYGVMRYKKQASELTKIDEAVSKAKDLKTLLARHSELAIAANKDGDHEAVKYHQNKMNNVKNQMAKLAKEEVELGEAKSESSVEGGKLKGHMVNFRPTEARSGDDVVKKVKSIAASLQKQHPDKVFKGAVSYGYGDYSFNDKHRGPKTGFVVVKHKDHLDSVKQHIKSHGATIEESTNVEPIHEISKELAKSYLDKTVDPVYGMPKHGMKDRMKGIRQASNRVLKKAGKTKTN